MEWFSKDIRVFKAAWYVYRNLRIDEDLLISIAYGLLSLQPECIEPHDALELFDRYTWSKLNDETMKPQTKLGFVHTMITFIVKRFLRGSPEIIQHIELWDSLIVYCEMIHVYDTAGNSNIWAQFPNLAFFYPFIDIENDSRDLLQRKQRIRGFISANNGTT